MPHHYEIHNYAEGNEYVNVDSVITNIEEIWTTQIPSNYKPNADAEQPTKPYMFDKRADALSLLDQLKSHRLQDWRKNEMIYRRCGKQKPVWKIYKVVYSI